MATETLATAAQAASAKETLRFITCGSVDDGKSTLLGRMLWDAKLATEDQLATMERESATFGKAGKDRIDFALLLDGLAAEREQGITIDVAYRYFETEHRRFIVADTPGHEQYTRNMATAASTADLAVILVDARKGVLPQTRRHANIVHLMGISNVVLAVNKMDLVGWNRAVFERIKDDFEVFARHIGIERITAVPVSALFGDNITAPGANSPWYDGEPLFSLLETAPLPTSEDQPFRFAVQYVNRPDESFRGYCGTVGAGRIAAGARVTVLPSGRETTIERIVTADGEPEAAVAGDAVTLTLADDIDVSRGDMLVGAGDETCIVADQFQADFVWLGSEPMIPGRRFICRLGLAETNADVTAIKFRRNLETLDHTAAKTLEMNDIAVVTVQLARPLPFDSYAACRTTGAFVLIDGVSNATVGAGMIQHSLRRATNIAWHKSEIGPETRARQKAQTPVCLWFTGLSGAGKSTVANMVDKRLNAMGRHTYILDGDNVRHGLNRDLGFVEADRVENIRRMAEVAKLMVDAGLIVLVCAISPYRRDREMARELFADGTFKEIFIDTPLEACESRDPKGLYKMAREGKIPNFTGISAPYEAPDAPDVRLDTTDVSPEDAATDIVKQLKL